MTSKRLLIISMYYAPEPSGNAPYVTLLAEHLSAAGWDVTVVAGMPHYPSWKIHPGYRGRLRSRETRAGVTIQRYRTYVPIRPTLVRRLFYELTFVFQVLTSRLPRTDAVLAVVPALGDGHLARWLAGRRKTPYGLLFQDLVGRGAAQTGLAAGGLSRTAIATLERAVARSASLVGIVSEGFRAPLLAYGVPADEIRLVPNWTITPRVTTAPSELRSRLGFGPGELIVLHAGNMGIKQGLNNVLAAARMAATRLQEVKFVFVGDGSRAEQLRASAADLENVSFFGSQPDDMFADLLAVADVLLINEQVGVVDMSLPSKLTSYLAASRPILAAVSVAGSTADAVRATGAGVVVPSGDPEAMLREIEILQQDLPLRVRMGEAGAAYAAEHHDQVLALKNLERFVEDILTSRS